MWHASVSLQRSGRFLIDPATCERLAVRLLAGVGGNREWWTEGVHVHAGICHLRVAVTPDEHRLIGDGLATGDAGVTGPERPRTVLR